ncbi:hypothetical protein Tsubulata_007501 [Turnera subulata]|uniref:GRAM domain-containing protein n=1 Tax=Turnera subulata TaxID=218843 RepID=A0A9Q0FYT8_9ROSI|nr:hypothetical protein Tsubulata_007501 [Turnera subulata]
MEPQPKPETESKPDPDSRPNSKPTSPSAPKTGDDHPQGSPNGEAAARGSFLMGSDSETLADSENRPGSARKSVHWSPDLVTESHASGNANDNVNNVRFDGSNPYVSSSPAPSSSSSNPSFSIKGKCLLFSALLKTGPSFTDAALGRIAQGTKVLAEGGYEKIFRQTFETVPEELLQNSYACYLSTSAGPVMGILYVSTAKLAFSSDNPLSYKSGGQTEWSYYKVCCQRHGYMLAFTLSI